MHYYICRSGALLEYTEKDLLDLDVGQEFGCRGGSLVVRFWSQAGECMVLSLSKSNRTFDAAAFHPIPTPPPHSEHPYLYHNQTIAIK